MERYFCSSASCNKEVGDKICPDCGSKTELIPDGQDVPTLESRSEALSPSAGAEFQNPLLGAMAQPSEFVANDVKPPVDSTTSSSTDREDLTGASAPEMEQVDEVLRTLIAGRAEIYLTSGIISTGKTQFLGASSKVSHLVRDSKLLGRPIPNQPRELKMYSYACPGREVFFIDASGEYFRQLYPEQRQNELVDSDLLLLRTVAQNIRGLALVMDLDKVWVPQKSFEEDQEKILRWILRLICFLHFGGTAREKINFTTQVESTVDRLALGRYLPFPVHLTFSKADLLLRRAVGSTPAHPRWPDPRTRSPLLYAHRMFPDLMSELRLHVQNFRVDFAQAVGEDPETGRLTRDDWDRLGVDASLDWLATMNLRGRGPSISTDGWLKLQEFWDDTILRRNRWGRQPLMARGGR